MSASGARFQPRPYQAAAVRQVLALYERGQRNLLLHLPTGSGKTVIASLIIDALLRRWDGAGRVLFLAHRKELLEQTAATLRRQIPGVTIGIEQGRRRADLDARIVIASIQSLVHRKDRYPAARFAAIICDECHRALAPRWLEVIGYFRDQRPDATLLLGMTATPRRSDGRSATALFDTVAYAISRPELQDLGYLAPVHYWSVRADLRLDQVAMAGADFQVTSLSRAMNQPAVRALTLRAWEQHGRGRKTLGFAASVAHARQLTEEFAAAGYRAACIDGRTQQRERLLDRFARGELDILFNYGVLIEGFDDPSIECLLMARPTTSPLVYEQCMGRGLRTRPGKSACTVIDIVDRSTHQLQYSAPRSAGLPDGWRCRGRDPFREARALRGIKVSDPDAFLAIRAAGDLDQVQDLLMALPPEVVVAGLDGEPVLNYQPVADADADAEPDRTAPMSDSRPDRSSPSALDEAEIAARIRAIADQAGATVTGIDLVAEPGGPLRARVSLRHPRVA
ncbi:MAG: DEAD/DEAH box helicase, partial [Myxococcota bacterium]